LAVLAFAGATVPLSAGAAPATRLPGPLPADSFARLLSARAHSKVQSLSATAAGLVQNGGFDADDRLPTFPTWRGSFESAGTTFPFVMAGRNPRKGDETRLETAFIALNFLFDEFVDANGQNVFIDTQPVVRDVITSPNFFATQYTDGFGQFSDAVQRASFFNVMERDWHSTLEPPRILTPVTIEVPVGAATVSQVNGKFVATVGFDFLFSELQTILQLADIRTDEVVMLVSRNVSADVALGFHDAIDVTKGGRSGIQTYLWTSWLDEDTVPLIFADATTITHEVSEWMADPFGTNPTPLYAIPDSGDPPFCQNVLEVGDPIEFLPNQMAPITAHGRVYHTQVETLLPWFSREVPSSAFQGAYSYPDTTVLVAPSPVCPTP
jgi:hypothetical protein